MECSIQIYIVVILAILAEVDADFSDIGWIV